MENTNNRRLTFPQRNWLLLCLVTALITALVYYFVDTSKRNSAERYDQTGVTGSSPSVTCDTSKGQGTPPDSLPH